MQTKLECKKNAKAYLGTYEKNCKCIFNNIVTYFERFNKKCQVWTNFQDCEFSGHFLHIFDTIFNKIVFFG